MTPRYQKINWPAIITFILGAAIVLFYWKGCNPCPELGETKTKIKTVHIPGKPVKVVDSTYYRKYHELLDQMPVEKPLYSDKIPSRIVKKIEKENEKDPCGQIRRFETPFNSSTAEYAIDGKIVSLVKGELLSSDFKFTTKSLIVNEKTNTTDTIRIEIEKQTPILKNHLWLGVESSVKPGLEHVSVTLDWTHKKGLAVGYRFENNFTHGESHNIRIAKSIW